MLVILNRLVLLYLDVMMLTGFPRNLKQAEALHHSETMPEIVIDLQVPFEVIIDRISKRWIHEPSGRVYNLDFNKPKEPVCSVAIVHSMELLCVSSYKCYGFNYLI